MRPTLPIKACLVTIDGFARPVDLEPAEWPTQVIYIPRLNRVEAVLVELDDRPPDKPVMDRYEFVLERWKIVQQNKGLRHIVAVYRER